MPDRQVYLLDPQKLSPEVIAVTFAKTSRSPQSFNEIAAELTEAKSAEFHEKWVVGYGHASVAEHAVLHIAIENLSRLAVEALESSRLASFTEKSTRYQKWGPRDFFIPPELNNHPLRVRYENTCSLLFNTYHQAIPVVQGELARQYPRQLGESGASYEKRLRTSCVDVCRFLLPAASLANVGMTINARTLEHTITKLLSHPLQEVRDLGSEIKTVAQKAVPTLVKYAQASRYLIDSSQGLTSAAQEYDLQPGNDWDWCRLVSCDSDMEDRLLAAVIYRYSNYDYAQILALIKISSPAERQNLTHLLLARLGKFDIPLREIEHASFTFDLILDQGAYFELKRHRMMTQTPQPLTASLGYCVPKLIHSSGLEPLFRLAMDSALQMYVSLAEFNPAVASYVIPNAFNRRVLLTMNLRSAEHLILLRSAENAHFSMQRVSIRLAQEIRTITPLLSSLLRFPTDKNWQDLEAEHFVQTR